MRRRVHLCRGGWLIPVLLNPVNPALLYNHAVFMVLYLTLPRAQALHHLLRRLRRRPRPRLVRM